MFVCSTSTRLQGYLLKNTMEVPDLILTLRGADVYTLCQGEHGIADNILRSSAVASGGGKPYELVFVHDPCRGKNLHDWFSLEGNPDPKPGRRRRWSTSTKPAICS